MDHCPDEEYDYDANEEEEPEDIDPDQARPKMIRIVTDAFKLGWEKDDGYSS